MTHSTLTNQIKQSTQRSSRKGRKINSVQLHHQASTNDDATIAMMVNKTRQVSANYTVSNEGRVTCVVDEDFRAWTSGSPVDDEVAITIEIENQSANGWTVSAAAHEKVAQLVADVAKRYGFSINRTSVYGHRELWLRHKRSYATACPGGLDLDAIVRRAQAIAGGVAPAAPKPTPKPSSVPFPLPRGAYFGPKSGPVESVSGYYSHREDLRKWQAQMRKRGWSINPDGLYGDKTALVASSFQSEKGLVVDGLIGIDTWNAAWTAPIT